MEEHVHLEPARRCGTEQSQTKARLIKLRQVSQRLSEIEGTKKAERGLGEKFWSELPGFAVHLRKMWDGKHLPSLSSRSSRLNHYRDPQKRLFSHKLDSRTKISYSLQDARFDHSIRAWSTDSLKSSTSFSKKITQITRSSLTVLCLQLHNTIDARRSHSQMRRLNE